MNCETCCLNQDLTTLREWLECLTLEKDEEIKKLKREIEALKGKNNDRIKSVD